MLQAVLVCTQLGALGRNLVNSLLDNSNSAIGCRSSRDINTTPSFCVSGLFATTELSCRSDFGFSSNGDAISLRIEICYIACDDK